MKTLKAFRFGIIAILIMFAAAFTYAIQKEPDGSVQNHQKSSALTKEILKILDERHFLTLPLDDALSSKLLDNYIDRLDPNKAFFYQADISEFNQYRTILDDQLKNGDDSAGFIIYDRFRQRIEDRLQKVIALLQDDQTIFDFTKDESLNTDTANNTWLESIDNGDGYWRKRIKSFLLSQKLSGDSPDKSRQQLEKRYINQLARVQKNSDDEIYEIYINSLTELYDPHTNYLAPRTSENFNINMSLSLEGIGAVLQTEDEHTKVVRVVTGGPAQKQGELKASDKITAVAQGDDGELIDVIGWRLDEVVQLIRGPKDSVVRLQISPAADTPQKGTKYIRIKRDKVKLEDQAAQKAVFTVDRDGSPYKVGVINIPAFYLDFEAYRNRDPNFKSTTRDVLKLLIELEKEEVDGVVIDLRNNGGGSLQEATTLTDLFIDKGPVVQIGRGDDDNSTTESRFNAHYRGPLVVMINRLSASASEIFAGAIQDYKRGLIVGSQSFGKGTVQSLTPLKARGDLKITESKFYRVSGDSTQHRGVIPDISFPELLDTETIGESSYDTALVWSKTKAVPYSQYLPIASTVSTLTLRHEMRIDNDPDFLYLTEQKKLLDDFTDKKIISLNESVRLKEKISFEQATLILENNRRSNKNLPLFSTYEAFSDDNELKNTERAAKAGTTVIDINDDAMLKEAGYILKDFSELLSISRKDKVARIQP
ncbi:MAG: carboxyl-terminal processing protease [Cellvibrionaceae bacterium]|jgi:carboxyl-terminal processing protease